MFLLWSHCDHLINRRQVRCIVLQGVTGIDRTSDIIPDLPFDLSTFSSFFVSFSLSLFFRFSSFSCMKLGIVFRSWCRFSGDEGIWKKGSSSNLGINETFPFLGTNPLDWSNQSPRIYHSFPYHFAPLLSSTCLPRTFLAGFGPPMICTVYERLPELIYIQNSTFPRIPVNADAVTRQNAVVQGCLAFVSRQLSSGIRGGKKKHRLITARRS